MDKIFVCAAFLAFLSLSCSKDVVESNGINDTLVAQLKRASPSSDYKHFILPDEKDLGMIPQDSKNPLTFEKIELGKLLFYETGFAGDALRPEGIGTYSCSSCHIPEAGFRANRPQGIADGGLGFGFNGQSRTMNTNYAEYEIDVQSARPLSLINVAYVTNTFWNGQFGSKGANEGTEAVWELRADTERNFLGFEGIETVNFEGLFTHRIKVDAESISRLGYKDKFDEVFHNVPEEERYNNRVASLALSAYIRSIISNQAPFQKWLKGDHLAMTKTMKEGAVLFFGKANCSNCHYEPNLGSDEFHVLGVKDMYQRSSYNAFPDDIRNLGRGGFTLKDEDFYKFKVPGLYNIGDSPWYFHGASKTTLEEVLDYKINAKSENIKVSQELISPKFKPLDLTENEKLLIKEFLEYGLRDPDLLRYQPDSVLSGNCFPNSDIISLRDMGCS